MTSIFVAKLDFGVTGEQLKQAFQDYGTVLKASVAMDRETGKSRGFGFVEMVDREEALKAIDGLDGSMMSGRPIAVKEAEQRTDSRPPRDSNSPRPDFNRNNESGAPRTPFQRTETRVDSESTGFAAPAVDPLKTLEQRKKEKEKKIKDWGDTEGRAKKPKMNAYKKSGKANRFFDDEEDDDFDIQAVNHFDEDEIDDDEEDFEGDSEETED
jgi:RNA recognition motif-containing protein